MELLCSEDHKEEATNYCICRFPLLPFCDAHAEEHQAQSSDFHLALPLTATKSISTKSVYDQVKSLLIRLNDNSDILREKLEDLSLCEDQVEAAYQETLQRLKAARQRLKEDFLRVKEEFQTVVENAINETWGHVMDYRTYIPGDSLSQFLWYSDTGYLSAYQFYTFQANCAPERLTSVLPVWLYLNVPGLEGLHVSHCDTALSIQNLEFVRQITAKEKMHQSEIVSLTQRLEETNRMNQAEEKGGSLIQQSTEWKLESLSKELASKSQTISVLRRDNGMLREELAKARNAAKDESDSSPANPEASGDVPSSGNHDPDSQPKIRSKKREGSASFWKSLYSS